ncbi:MAG: hypothetical protein ABJN36_12685 [Cyclobacteriaceae bacterium]
MKNLIYITLILVSVTGVAQKSKFTRAILKGKEMLSTADTVTAFISAANYFERIKLNEPDEWLPAYYQARALTVVAMKGDKEKKEEVLNTALEVVQTAQVIERNSELVALEGYVQMLRLTVDPATRGRTLSPVIFKLFDEALQLDLDNPRAMIFLGQMEFGTAQFFGSGTEKACGYIEKAAALFEEESDEDTILPMWGAEALPYYQENCNQ